MYFDFIKSLNKAKTILGPKYEYIDRIRLVQGKILEQQGVDTVVSFMTADMKWGGPLNQAILKLSGHGIDDYVRDTIKNPDSGEVFAIPSHGLPYKNLFVAILPEWESGIDDEDRNLLRCYRRSIDKAKELNVTSIAFPALGRHRLKYPHLRFARLAVQGIAARLNDQLEEVRIVCAEEEMVKVYEKRLEKYGWTQAS